MFERTAHGWEMMKESWRVLQQDKELLLFPVLSSIACVLIMASFALPLIVSPTLRVTVFASVRSDKQQQPDVAANGSQNPGVHKHADDEGFKFSAQQIVPAIVGFAFYLSTSFVIVFFNTALVCCALRPI